ncbi:MAG: TRAP transporter large permease [Gammaproteobacteria bacterium]|nr:TRAP transporter large permease [Gammaproteobacteria bacterium]
MNLDPLTIGLLFSSVLILFIFSGVRVVYAAAAIGMLGMVNFIGWDAGLGLAGTIPHSKAVAYTLSVLPLFVLIGFMAYHAGITTGAFAAARAWLGWLPGGMAIATVFASAGFAAVSGASTATSAVFSRIAIPEMLKAGYDRRLSAGVVAAGGTLASLIPPSAMLVLYAIIVEESVGKLLLAGFIPGILSAFIYLVLIVIMCVRNPKLGPAIETGGWAMRFKTLPGTTPILAVVAILFSAVYFGWATPTEGGALGAFVVFIIAMFRRMTFEQFRGALLETAKLTAMIFSIIWGILIFVRFLGYARIPDAFSAFITGLDYPPIVIMICILLAYAILGMFMDAIGMLLLTLPVVYPAVIALGYDPIWFGIIVVKMVEVCLITPPIGLNCYVVNGVRPDIPLSDIFRGIFPFFIADVATVALFIAFPEIITWLPSQMLG